MHIQFRAFTLPSTEIVVNDHYGIMYLLFVVAYIKMYLNSHQESQDHLESEMRIPIPDRFAIEGCLRKISVQKSNRFQRVYGCPSLLEF